MAQTWSLIPKLKHQIQGFEATVCIFVVGEDAAAEGSATGGPGVMLLVYAAAVDEDSADIGVIVIIVVAPVAARLPIPSQEETQDLPTHRHHPRELFLFLWMPPIMFPKLKVMAKLWEKAML